MAKSVTQGAARANAAAAAAVSKFSLPFSSKDVAAEADAARIISLNSKAIQQPGEGCSA